MKKIFTSNKKLRIITKLLQKVDFVKNGSDELNLSFYVKLQNHKQH